MSTKVMAKKKMYGEVVFVTPTMAKEFLKNRNKNNRPVDAVDVARLERSMMNGQFMATHQGAAFTEDGMLIDGHHRFEAIVNCGEKSPTFKGVEMFIIYNAPVNSYEFLDSGRKRTCADRASEARLRGELVYFSQMALRMANRAFFGMNPNKKLSDYEKLDLIQIHKDKIQFLEGKFKRVNNKKTPNLTRGGVLGAFLRFAYQVDEEMLAEATYALIADEINKYEKYDSTSIRTLRRYLLSYNDSTGVRNIVGGGAHLEYDLYEKTTKALNAFKNNEKLHTVSNETEEVFLFPDDVEIEQRNVFGDYYNTLFGKPMPKKAKAAKK